MDTVSASLARTAFGRGAGLPGGTPPAPGSPPRAAFGRGAGLPGTPPAPASPPAPGFSPFFGVGRGAASGRGAGLADTPTCSARTAATMPGGPSARQSVLRSLGRGFGGIGSFRSPIKPTSSDAPPPAASRIGS